MKPELKRAVRLVEKGKSFGEAADLVGITRNRVAGACYRAGVKGQNAPDGSQTRKAVAMYQSGAPLAAIVEALGHKPGRRHSYGSVYSLLYRAGLKGDRQPRA